MKSTTAGGTNSPDASRRPGWRSTQSCRAKPSFVAGASPGPDVLKVLVAQGVVAQQVRLALRQGEQGRPLPAGQDGPGQPRLPELADQALPTFLLDAECGPAPVFPELLQELRPRQRSLLPTNSAPKVFMSAAARTLPTPKSRSMSRRVRSGRSSCSSWLMTSGMARSHRGFAGTVEVLQRQVPAVPAGGVVNGVRAGDVGRDVDPLHDPSVAAPGRLCRPARRPGRRRFRAGWRPPS